MMWRTLCAVVVLCSAMSVAKADPMVLGPAQMDAVTAGGNSYADAQADAIGRNAFTKTSTNALTFNGLPNLLGYGAGGQAAALAIASGPTAYTDVSARAGILNGLLDLTGYGAGGEAVALATATGPSAFAEVSAGVVNMNGQTYLTGYAAGGAATGLAIVTAPIPLSTGRAFIVNGQPYWLTHGGSPGKSVWSPPAGARAAVVSQTSTEESGMERVTYTLSTGGQNSDALTGVSATMSLSFSKPPLSIIPPVFVISISGPLPITINTLLLRPAVR